MTTSPWSSRVCDDPTSPPRSTRRTAASLATAAGLALLLAAAPAGAANCSVVVDRAYDSLACPAPACS